MKRASLRTQKGVIEVELDLQDNKISTLKITGDFFVYPEEALEQFEEQLVGLPLDQEKLYHQISEIYSNKKISTPGITIDDWVQVILKTCDNL